jgi:hypothetical protein
MEFIWAIFNFWMELEEWKGVNGKRWEVKCYLVYGDIHNSDNYTLNNQYILDLNTATATGCFNDSVFAGADDESD